MQVSTHKMLGGALLIAGTAIGAGMLALPITTGVGGFFPSAALFVLSFVYMLVSLFLVLESTLYSKDVEANMITMSRAHLGGWGQAAAWLSFCLLLYAVAAAYMSGGGSLIGKLLNDAYGFSISPTDGALLFVVIFGVIVFFGTTIVDYLNRLLMAGLILAYLALAFFVTPHVEMHNLVEGHPKYLLAAVPVVLLSFTSHIIVPSLRTYFKNDIKSLKRSLLIGSCLPLLFYLVWELVIVGVLSNTDLAAVADAAHPVSELTSRLHDSLHLSWVAFAVGSFSFFALVTSFLGVILSLSDFLADGFQIKKNFWGRSRLALLTLVPPLGFALFYPSGFILALGYAGVFVAILYGIMPVLMVWKARYREGLTANFKVFGGKPLLVVMFMGGLVVIGFQVAATLHWLPSP